MTKTGTAALVIGAVLICASMVAHVADPVQASRTRKIFAGKASLQVPLNMPGEVASGNPASGAVLMGSRDECDITFDRFTAIYWSGRSIPGSALLPTPAYVKESEQAGSVLDLGRGKRATTRIIGLSAEKPCGRVVRETLNVIDMYCGSTRTHYALVGMQDPFMTMQRLVEIAQTLHCP